MLRMGRSDVQVSVAPTITAVQSQRVPIHLAVGMLRQRPHVTGGKTTELGVASIQP